MSRNVQQEVTDRILAELEKGAAPWVKPWRAFGVGNGIPKNAMTKRPYSGGNVFLLLMTAVACDYPVNQWLTYKQAAELGGNVRKGEKGTTVYFASRFTKEEDGKEKSIPFLKAFTLFNVAQCEGLPEDLFETPAAINPDQRDAIADAFVAATGANITEGTGEAYYIPSKDTISMPAFEAFRSSDHFYATMFHELGHWTGAEHRVNRNIKNSKGSVDYAFEELVAELTSAFICAEFGFDGDLRHAGYIQTWIKLLKDDARAFTRAAAAAQRAADHLRGLAIAEIVDEAA